MQATAVFLLFILLFGEVHLGSFCNQAVCGRIVTKCLILKSCYCDVKHMSCAKSCRKCLGKYYRECCDCVGK